MSWDRIEITALRAGEPVRIVTNEGGWFGLRHGDGSIPGGEPSSPDGLHALAVRVLAGDPTCRTHPRSLDLLAMTVVALCADLYADLAPPSNSPPPRRPKPAAETPAPASPAALQARAGAGPSSPSACGGASP